MPLGFHRKPTGKPGEWFYCIKHNKVEEGPECPAKDRLGPYATRDEAAHALQLVEERNREWRNASDDKPEGGAERQAE